MTDYRQTDYKQTDRHDRLQTDRQTDYKQTDRETRQTTDRQTDRLQTDMTKPTVTSQKFANSPTKNHLQNHAWGWRYQHGQQHHAADAC